MIAFMLRIACFSDLWVGWRLEGVVVASGGGLGLQIGRRSVNLNAMILYMTVCFATVKLD